MVALTMQKLLSKSLQISGETNMQLEWRESLLRSGDTCALVLSFEG